MNVASLELCKELYELSGWEQTRDWWFKYMKAGRIEEWRVQLDAEHKKIGKYDVPAYDLGYLLRKLQANDQTIVLRWNRDMGGRIALKAWDNKYCIGTFDMPQGDYPVADTPEDAATMLAIALFKRGVLTRDGDE